ncbi:hypothetical protein [Moritella viscosa]|uniref:hypothetical protein n=1 Tax=Moritella viscosa TaxID=80854 RepID=UPI000AA137D7|nr:hypothetical protein [Moritella viscosa]
MKLWIYRPAQLLDAVRNYKLYADGKFVTYVKRGQRFAIDVPDDTQILQAKLSWCSSQPIYTNDLSHGAVTVKNAFSHNPILVLFCSILFYSVRNIWT